MNIVQITPSAGDSFYCENCLRDTALVKAMIGLGHEVLMVPLYLPLSLGDPPEQNMSPIFFGGVNVYLQQKASLFRKTPRWLDSVFDSPRLLKLVGKMAGMTSAEDLGETTISMLRGEEGRQIKELNRLVEWLKTQENKPDIVCLSNVLLTGLARSIRQRLGVPVVCLLQDEDGFLDGLPAPYAEHAWSTVAERSKDVDAFVAVSKYYAQAMRQRIGFSSEKIHVVYTGISLDGYTSPGAEPEVPTIGFLSQMCPAKGLDVLIDAFTKLKKTGKLGSAILRATGGRGAGDKAYLEQIKRKLNAYGLADDVEFLPEFDARSKLAFLRSLSVLSVPEKQPVAYGLYALEALAAGVPVVQPASGVFPELLDMTGGCVLYEPNSPNALVEALKGLLLDPARIREMGRRGRKVVLEKFDINKTAAEMVRTYERIAEKSVRG
jgi:glycosyltransferase involved in cell wall biosynthesis